MKTSLPFLLLSFLLCTASLGVTTIASAEFIDTFELGLHSSFRVDQIDWNIAGIGGNPNILSELDWKNLEIWQIGVTGKLSVGNDIADYRTYIRGSLEYGWITDGTVRDSDYHGNNRSMEFSRSRSVTEDDNVLDGSIGLGFEKKYWQNRCTLGWLGGYSYHEQNLRLTNGVQHVPDLASIIGLDSTYESKWYGPFVGIDLELRPHPRISLEGSVEYHWADYEGKGNWNLRSDLAHPESFRNEADKADGVVGSLKGSYFFNRVLVLDLRFDYRDFSARDGVERTFLADGTSINTKLNETNWQSYATSVGFTYRF